MSVNDLKARKNELRSKHKRLRGNFTPEKKAEIDLRIAERFLSLPEYIGSSTVLAYVSKDIEVGTEAIINRAFSDGKTVAVPKCDTDLTTIEFYEINSYRDLEKGYYGLSEPRSGCKKAEDFSSAMCIVPGLAFDGNGSRLGFGKGYYDRFLAGFTGAAVGICYSECIEAELPAGRFDLPVDLVVTEKSIIDTRKNGDYEHGK